jgi:hypothetical protein
MPEFLPCIASIINTRRLAVLPLDKIMEITQRHGEGEVAFADEKDMLWADEYSRTHFTSSSSSASSMLSPVRSITRTPFAASSCCGFPSAEVAAEPADDGGRWGLTAPAAVRCRGVHYPRRGHPNRHALRLLWTETGLDNHMVYG